jgi:hypothetical protein
MDPALERFICCGAWLLVLVVAEIGLLLAISSMLRAS